jgi:hypothetical protein
MRLNSCWTACSAAHSGKGSVVQAAVESATGHGWARQYQYVQERMGATHMGVSAAEHGGVSCRTWGCQLQNMGVSAAEHSHSSGCQQAAVSATLATPALAAVVLQANRTAAWHHRQWAICTGSTPAAAAAVCHTVTASKTTVPGS